MAPPDPILDRLPDAFRETVDRVSETEKEIQVIEARIRTIETTYAMASSSAWPPFMKAVEGEIEVVRRRLETVPAQEPASVARLQGRLDSFRLICEMPDRAAKGLDNLKRRRLELSEQVKTLRERPEVLWYERRKAPLEKSK